MKQAARPGQIIIRLIGCLIAGATVLGGTAAGVAGTAPGPIHVVADCGLPWGVPCGLPWGGPVGTSSVA